MHPIWFRGGKLVEGVQLCFNVYYRLLNIPAVFCILQRRCSLGDQAFKLVNAKLVSLRVLNKQAVNIGKLC